MDRFVHAVATGFFTGYLPWVPATWGTLLVGIPLYLAVHTVGPLSYTTILAALTLLSVYTAGRMEVRTGQRDPHCVVIDEIVGYLCAMAFLPCSGATVALSFFFFRGFDIVKPYPVGLADRRVRGGLGITLDDVIAGVMANICVRGILWLF